jgi:antirestriction protein ArdC
VVSISLQVANYEGNKMSNNAYEIVAQSIISQLEKGTAPWRKEWVASGYEPLSLSSKKRYNGINHWLLSFSAMGNGYSSPWWGTFKQVKAMGGSVRKGEKGTPVVLYKQFDTTNADGEPKKAVVMRYFTVFNADQADWENEAPKYQAPETRQSVEIIESAQKIVDTYFSREAVTLAFGGDRAYYSPSADAIQLPKQESFTNDNSFYATAFHEMGHSTGHKSRLNRDGVVENHYFGSELYSEEELVAEFTSAFLSSETGVLPETINNSASYIASWLKALKNDPKMLVKAVGRAQKATDYILNGAKVTAE